MFKANGSEKKLAQLLEINDENVDELLKRMSGFLSQRKVISKRNLADSFFVLEDIKIREAELRSKRTKIVLKNPVLLKYEETIVNLYKQGHGYLSISNQLKARHNASLSRSSIFRYIKKMEISRDE